MLTAGLLRWKNVGLSHSYVCSTIAADDRERACAPPGRTLQAPLSCSVCKHGVDVKIILEGRQAPQTEEVKVLRLYIHTEPRNYSPINGVHSIANQAANQGSRRKA